MNVKRRVSIIFATALCTSSISGIAVAQTGAGPMLEEIIVTSRRYEENMQDAPLAVAVITDDYIATFMHDELEMWDTYGAACFAPYQIEDAPYAGNVGEGGFGVFTNLADGFNEKPVARVLRDWFGRG